MAALRNRDNDAPNHSVRPEDSYDAAHMGVERSRDRQRMVGRDIALASDCNSDDEIADHGGSCAPRR